MFIDKFSENTILDNWNIKKIGELPLIITDYVANGSFASLKSNITILKGEKNSLKDLLIKPKKHII